MRRFHILPVLAIFACLGMGADTRLKAAKAAPSGGEAEGKSEKVTIAAEPPPPPLPRGNGIPDPGQIREWCSTEEKGAIELANALRSRSAALDEREKLLGLREEEMKDSEKKLVERLEELKKLREEISQQLEDADKEKKTKVDELVKMVEANRPANIAAMFEALDEPLAVQVLDRMNPTKAGKLLAALNPTKAARLAGKMAHPVTGPVASAEAPPAPAAPPAAPSPTPAPAASPAPK